MKRNLPWPVVALLVCGITSVYATKNIDPHLKAFAAQKRQQAEDLAAKLHLDVPSEVREFFKAAEAGDCNGVSNSYARIQRLTSQLDSNISPPGYPNVLNVPIHETRGAYDFCDWDGGLLQQYADAILSSIPAGSVYFGGTDLGRFVVTMFHDTAKSPPLFILTQKFVITQNMLWDQRYMEYLRLTCGDQLWLPTAPNELTAFQEFVSDIQVRRQRGEPIDPDEDFKVIGDRITVNGVKSAMAVNGNLVKIIFDNNKDKHEFYIEESYVIPWMYPYLEPHRLILKLNREPLAQLEPAIATRDRKYWDKLTKELLTDPKFLSNARARWHYAKMRSAIGGVYAYRKLYIDAQAAYQQAVKLCPDSPEANFRLAQLYVEQNHHDDAVAVLEQLRKAGKPDTKLDEAIEQVREMKRKAEQAK